MRVRSAAAVLLAALALGCGRKPGTPPPDRTHEPPPAADAPRTVRVAAIQFHSVMGKPSDNRERLIPLVERAAAGGAKIVVLPEAAIPGYADLSTDTFWSKGEAGEKGYLPVRDAAEAVPGPSTELFAPLVGRLGIYLTVPIIERAEGKYYNTVVLLGPDGKIAARHRKYNLWPVADSSWASEGPRRATVVDTEHGRIGLMICYDVHALLGEFGKAKADIVLHSVAFYGLPGRLRPGQLTAPRRSRGEARMVRDDPRLQGGRRPRRARACELDLSPRPRLVRVGGEHGDRPRR